LTDLAPARLTSGERCGAIARAIARRRWCAGAAILLLAGTASAESAGGAIDYASKVGTVTVAVKHAYLVEGPDVASGKNIRRIVLSVADVASKINACGNMMCSDGDLAEGMTVDIGAGPRLNYWIVANGQRIQYSGTAVPASIKLTVDTAQRVAGTLVIDDRAAGGPSIRVDFDAPLLKQFGKAM
jgi:hypothetical protein